MPEGACRYVGPAFRAHDPEWAFAPSSGEGARLNGGRFNKPGRNALYLSTTSEGAINEASQGGFLPPPMTLVSYHLDVEDLLNTFSKPAAARYDLPEHELGGANWRRETTEGRLADSQSLAERLITEGFAGMIVPSFTGSAPQGARNIVLWRWSDELPYKVDVHDPNGLLPKDRSSWSSDR
ncbi:MAG: RES domain-containing protein [Pseudomonadota bacterium]